MFEADCITKYDNVRQRKTKPPKNKNLLCTATTSQEYKLQTQNPLWI